jgi:hypothetical protein
MTVETPVECYVVSEPQSTQFLANHSCVSQLALSAFREPKESNPEFW